MTPPGCRGITCMLPQLPFGQQARGLPSGEAAQLLPVLPIELQQVRGKLHYPACIYTYSSLTVNQQKENFKDAPFLHTAVTAYSSLSLSPSSLLQCKEGAYYPEATCDCGLPFKATA